MDDSGGWTVSEVVAVQNPSNTPFLGDGAWAWGRPKATDTLPDDLLDPLAGLEGQWPPKNGEMAVWCLERHGKGINMAFVDGHVQRIRPKQLWTLDWYDTFQEERAELLGNGKSP